MSVFVLNFQAPKDLDELRDFYERVGVTNIDILEKDALEGTTIWTVPGYAEEGDTVVFSCARTAKDHMAHVCVQAKATGEEDLIRFAEEQKAKYKRYSGKFLATGIIAEMPRPDEYFGGRAYSAAIKDMRLIEEPIDIAEFKGNISLSTFSAHTRLNSWQWKLIENRIKKGN